MNVVPLIDVQCSGARVNIIIILTKHGHRGGGLNVVPLIDVQCSGARVNIIIILTKHGHRGGGVERCSFD